MNPRYIVVLMAATALAPFAAAAAGAGTASLELTAGSRAYRALSARASFETPNDTYIAPRAAFYRSDDADGTYKLFGLRGGYEPGPWSFGADVAVQPNVDGYSKSSLGADAAHSFPLSGEEAFFDLGGGAAVTRHSDEFAAGGSNGRGRGRARTDEFVVRQTDLVVFAALRGAVASLAGRLTKSAYDRDLAEANARRRLSAGEAFDAAVLGFPDTRASAILRVKAPPVEPFLAVTRTTFRAGDPPATGLEAGAKVRRGDAAVTASIERYRQAGYEDRTYVSVGGSLDF